MNKTTEGRIFQFSHTYTSLPEVFYKKVTPDPVPRPELIFLNINLAKDLAINIPMLEEEATAGEDFLASVLSGNTVLPDSLPIAQAYAGHQFGYFTMLGDGRAILLGEHLDAKGNRFDIQLKGSGRTPYSRGGDGRASAHSMLRELIISESMHGLGIPTSRSLALVSTGRNVHREEIHPGMILTRISSSHIRVGTFECAYHLLKPEDSKALLDYTIQRHYPDLATHENPAKDFFHAVISRQVELIVNWMRVGFIHGVMNTDNMSIAGETFDYGPCAFMNAYDPATVFSSIDTGGRYAFGNQPPIAQWNLACLANSLLSFFHEDEKKAIEIAKEALDGYAEKFDIAYWNMMGEKIGISRMENNDRYLVEELRNWMHKNGSDYTNTFLALESFLASGSIVDTIPPYPGVAPQDSELSAWLSRWTTRLKELYPDHSDCSEAVQLMQKSNPFVIPRNHLVEEALDPVRYELAGKEALSKALELIKVMRSPYQRVIELSLWNEPPPQGDKNYKTFCGT